MANPRRSQDLECATAKTPDDCEYHERYWTKP